MAYIKVNHQKLLSSADQIDNYIAAMDKHMRNMESAIVSMGADWKGEDYLQLKKEWNEINSTGSTTDKMKTSLKSYAGTLREAAKLYKDAQMRAINRANNLCK